MKINEDIGATTAGSISSNRNNLFGQKSKPMKRIIDSTGNVPVIKFKNDSRKLKSYKRKGLMYSFGQFLAQNMPNPMSENFNLSDALSKVSNVTKQNSVPKHDTVQFGLEDDKGGIIKVFVDAEQANEFESALQQQLQTDMKKVEIAELLFSLRDEFNIINVVWPKIYDDAVEEEEQKGPNTEQSMEQEFNDTPNDENNNDDNNDDSNVPDDMSDEQGVHSAGENDIPVNDLESQDNVGDLSQDDQKATISSILAMLSADAEAKKADADARAAEARAKEAEAMARAAEAKIKSEEQILDMESYNKKSTQEKNETRKLAKLAQYRHQLKQDQTIDQNVNPNVTQLDADQHKRFEEEENNINQLDGFASHKSISLDTLMKIARQMQARENAQE